MRPERRVGQRGGRQRGDSRGCGDEGRAAERGEGGVHGGHRGEDGEDLEVLGLHASRRGSPAHRGGHVVVSGSVLGARGGSTPLDHGSHISVRNICITAGTCGGHRAGEENGATGRGRAGGHADDTSPAVGRGRPRAEVREPQTRRRGHPDHLVARSHWKIRDVAARGRGLATRHRGGDAMDVESSVSTCSEASIEATRGSECPQAANLRTC